MEISRKADYAVRAMVTLAADGNGRVTTSVLAQTTQVPYAFMTKIVAELASRGLVDVAKGRLGGVRIAADPATTTVLQVMEAIDGPLRLNRCAIKPERCPRSGFCSVHPLWLAARKDLEKNLSVSLESLAKPAN